MLDLDHVGDVGVPHGAELLAFADAVGRDASDDQICACRDALADAVGAEATLDAAATIAIFNGLLRVADGTGIELDAGVFTASIDERDRLGIDGFAGAANSADVVAVDELAPGVSGLFA